jgi:hypothetical protein
MFGYFGIYPSGKKIAQSCHPGRWPIFHTSGIDYPFVKRQNSVSAQLNLPFIHLQNKKLFSQLYCFDDKRPAVNAMFLQILFA